MHVIFRKKLPILSVIRGDIILEQSTDKNKPIKRFWSPSNQTRVGETEKTGERNYVINCGGDI
jgi:hypothetical protein